MTVEASRHRRSTHKSRPVLRKSAAFRHVPEDVAWLAGSTQANQAYHGKWIVSSRLDQTEACLINRNFLLLLITMSETQR